MRSSKNGVNLYVCKKVIYFILFTYFYYVALIFGTRWTILYENDQFLLGACFLLLGIIFFRKVLLNELKKINFLRCIKLVAISLFIIFLFFYMLSYFLFNQGVEINTSSFTWMSILNALVFAPFVEEIVNRFCLICLNRSILIKFITLFLSSILFSMGHQTILSSNFYMFWPFFILGLCLGSIYIKTKNIWYSVAVHFSYNLVVVVVVSLY